MAAGIDAVELPPEQAAREAVRETFSVRDPLDACALACEALAVPSLHLGHVVEARDVRPIHAVLEHATEVVMRNEVQLDLVPSAHRFEGLFHAPEASHEVHVEALDVLEVLGDDVQRDE